MINNWVYSGITADKIVISSSLSLSRNFSDYVFVDKMSISEARSLVDTVYYTFYSKHIEDQFTLIKLWECSESKLKVLLDEEIINEKLLKRKEKAAVIVNEDSNLAIIINEEDHIRISCKSKQMNLEESYKYINRIDNLIEENMTYSFSETLGYLTSSVSNVGTGLKVEVLMHLPIIVLQDTMGDLKGQLNKLKINIDGAYKKGSDVLGHMYTISNKATLGVSEIEIIKYINDIVINIADEENNLRQTFMENFEYELEDRVMRSYGVLKNAKILRENEILNLLSYVRMGAEVNLLNLDIETLDRLITFTKDSVIQYKYQNMLSESELKLIRANIVKKIL